MTQLDFFASSDDIENLVQEGLLKNGALFLSDRSYESPNAALGTDLPAFRASVGETRRFLFCTDANPELVFEQYSSGTKAGQYFIPPRWGGPYVYLTCSPQYTENGKAVIGAGSILIYPTYHSTSAESPVRAPRELKRLFKSAASVLMSRAWPSQPGGLYVCADAARRASSNGVLLRTMGRDYSVGTGDSKEQA